MERLLRAEIAIWGQDGQNGLTGTMKAVKADQNVMKREWAWAKIFAPIVIGGLLNGASLCNQQTMIGQAAKLVAKAMGWSSVCG